MGKKKLVDAMEIDLTEVNYESDIIQAPHLTGLTFKFFAWVFTLPLIGYLIASYVKKRNQMFEILRDTEIPEPPMFKPEYPPQDQEHEVIILDENEKAAKRVESALKCLPRYLASNLSNLSSSFRYWKIRDYAQAYRSKIITPSMVVENIISGLEEFKNLKPPGPLLISYDYEILRKEAADSTKRFEQGIAISVLDGIFIAIKDDIDCHPYPTKGATSWMHETRTVKVDAVCVSRLRKCGVVVVGKTNMHELGMGTTGNNPNYGTPRNPHATARYTGGSSSGPTAIVACGLCSAALGTDGGGSIRIPSSLCGVVGLKPTYGRINMEGSLCGCGTVEAIGPIASSVEDVMLVYAVILGSSNADRIGLNLSLPSLPLISPNRDILGSLRLGKYEPWFSDVLTTDIADDCSDVLNLLSRTCGCEVVEIVVPEIKLMRTAHIVTIGSEVLCSLKPLLTEGYHTKLTSDTQTSLALFESFSAADYVSAQRLRRRMMHHHMEIFKKVDIIVTPTTGITAPTIPRAAHKYGETNMQITGYLMRFVIAANLLGLPAISIPIGHDKQGLPIGLQLMGRPCGEATILRVAHAIEELCVNKRKRPLSFFDVLNI